MLEEIFEKLESAPECVVVRKKDIIAFTTVDEIIEYTLKDGDLDKIKAFCKEKKFWFLNKNGGLL